jgi:hypothetical protein
MALHLRSAVQAYCSPVCSQCQRQRKGSPGSTRGLSKGSRYSTRPIGLSRLVLQSRLSCLAITDYSRIAFHCQPQKYSLCTYIQLAISIVFDLGLHKSPPDESRPACDESRPIHNPWMASKTRTMNERRAVLSCFLLSSSYVASLGFSGPY